MSDIQDYKNKKHFTTDNEIDDSFSKEFFKETNIQVMDEVGPNIPARKKINASEMFSGGGLAQYIQSP